MCVWPASGTHTAAQHADQDRATPRSFRSLAPVGCFSGQTSASMCVSTRRWGATLRRSEEFRTVEKRVRTKVCDGGRDTANERNDAPYPDAPKPEIVAVCTVSRSVCEHVESVRTREDLVQHPLDFKSQTVHRWVLTIEDSTQHQVAGGGGLLRYQSLLWALS